VNLWTERSSEERGLLNPSFCAILLWNADIGHTGQSGGSLPFETAFLVLPIVLHKETREALPKSLATSLAVWLEMNPLFRSRIADRARMLQPFAKEAMLFGGLHGLLTLDGGAVKGNADWTKRIAKSLSGSSDEVRLCAKRADFIGKWFAKTGAAPVVMALIGVRP